MEPEPNIMTDPQIMNGQTGPTGQSGSSDGPETATGPSRDLGALPPGFVISWPTAPLLTAERSVDASQLQSALQSGQRFVVSGQTSTAVTINVSDVELAMQTGSRIKRLNIGLGVHRVHVVGGTFGEIEVAVPTSENEFATDLQFDGLSVVPDDDQYGLAFALRAKRAAIVDSHTSAFVYSVWVGGTAPLQSADLIFLNNEFNSTTGAEGTLRMHDVVRTATVGNRLTNGTAAMSNSKHNYRVHGVSRQCFAARNRLVHSGVMIGEGGGGAEDVDGYWFLANTFHQLRPSLYQMGTSGVRNATITDNVIYNGSSIDCFVCNTPLPATWQASNNELLPYQPAP